MLQGYQRYFPLRCVTWDTNTTFRQGRKVDTKVGVTCFLRKILSSDSVTPSGEDLSTMNTDVVFVTETHSLRDMSHKKYRM